MKDIYIDFLKYFEDVPIGKQKAIYPFLSKYFAKPIAINETEWDNQMVDVINFLNNIKEHGHLIITLKRDRISPYWAYWNESLNRGIWFDETGILASKTVKATDYLTQKSLNDSVIEVNKSLLESNRIISENSKSQTKAINNQTRLFLLTATFTVLSVTLSAYTVYLNSSVEEFKKQLAQQTKQIHDLQIQLNQKINYSLQKLNEKINFKKK